MEMASTSTSQINVKALIDKYSQNAKDIMFCFCEKYALDRKASGDWKGGFIGEKYLTDEGYTINFSDVLTDFTYGKDKEEYLDWYDYNDMCKQLGIETIRYYDWLLGAALPHTEETFSLLVRLHNVLSTEEFSKVIEQYNELLSCQNKSKYKAGNATSI